MLQVYIPGNKKTFQPNTHEIHHVGPSLHGDALEHRQHRQPEVVEVGDAEVGSLPVVETHVVGSFARAVVVLQRGAVEARAVLRAAGVRTLHHLHWGGAEPFMERWHLRYQDICEALLR